MCNNLLYISTLVFFGSILALASCTNSNSENLNSCAVVKTAVNPVSRRMPKLGIIEKAFWKAHLTGKNNNPLVPGMNGSSYKFWGFAEIDKAHYIDMKTTFVASLNLSGLAPEFIPSEYSLNEDCEWLYSNELTDYLLDDELTGSIYLNTKNPLVYFEINGD